MVRAKITTFTMDLEPLEETYCERVPRVGDYVVVDAKTYEVKIVEWERLKPPQVQMRVERV